MINYSDEKNETKGFFRFYEERDGFKETRPMYEKIVEALAKSGYISEQYIARKGDGTIDKEKFIMRLKNYIY